MAQQSREMRKREGVQADYTREEEEKPKQKTLDDYGEKDGNK